MGLNAVIYEVATGRIVYALRDATRAGNAIQGSNGRYVIGKRAQGLRVLWTEDEVARDETGDFPVFTPDNISSFTPAAADRDIGIVDRQDLIARLDRLRDMARITDSQIETYIGENVTDLASARTYLARLTKEMRDILRLALWLLKGGL